MLFVETGDGLYISEGNRKPVTVSKNHPKYDKIFKMVQEDASYNDILDVMSEDTSFNMILRHAVVYNEGNQIKLDFDCGVLGELTSYIKDEIMSSLTVNNTESDKTFLESLKIDKITVSFK